MPVYVSDQLTATLGVVRGSPTPTRLIQWFRGSTIIAGANETAYTVTEDDLGQPISVRQTEANYFGSAVVTSSATEDVQVFSPSTLFSASELGAWYDPSDLTTMFTDAAGATPVTVSGNTVGLLLDKSEGLVLGPELVVNGSFATDTGWTKGTGWTISGGVGVGTNVSAASLNATAFTTVVGRTYKVSFELVTRTSGSVELYAYDTSNIAGSGARSTPGVYSFIFVARQTSTILYFFSTTSFSGTVDNASVRELPGYHATQPTLAARPLYRVATNGDKVLENDGVDDALNVTFPNLGANCTVCYVTQSEVRLDEAVTLNGSYTLPNIDLLGFLAIDRALTRLEKIRLINYMASKAQGVTYGAGIDDLDLIALNATDLFVYDTSNDSDGGAWRTGGRAQASSWYQETLNTAVRGSRREFPAVAVIVAEAAKVTIYDGDDPALPMWMVFSANLEGTSPNRISALGGGSATSLSIAALDGQIVIGKNSTAQSSAALIWSFTRDRFGNYSNGVVWSGWAGVLSARQELGTLDASFPSIVSAVVNDVAMTVLPGAPIDPATGLPVPTIAVATAGGVSVIKDNGTVADSAATINVRKVDFNEDGDLLFTRNGWAASLNYSSSADYQAGDGFGDQISNTSGAGVPALQANGFSGVEYFGSTSAIGSNGPLAGNTAVAGLQLQTLPPSDFTKGMSALLTSTYNTGWMNGNIKGAFLSDTSATALVGSGELVTNGTFDTDTTGWTAGNATLSVVSNKLQIVSNAGGISYAEQLLSGLTLGQTYALSGTAQRTSGAQAAYVTIYTGTGTFVNNAVVTTGTEATGTLTFVASQTSMLVRLQLLTPTGSGDTGLFDNISVKLADADRSVNNKGLIVNGTVTRTAVAAGANLVAYSGFSAANYLEQPYNSALDFGTGDFCYMGWVKQDASLLTALVDRSSPARTGAIIDFRPNTSGALVFYTQADSSNISYIISANSTLQFGVYTFVTAVRRAGSLELWANGVQLTPAFSLTPTTARNVTNSEAILRVGLRTDGTIPFNGSLALLRISATAPTAEQITKIYNDELPLFQVNAQATLYGASDAVTALAHDPDTDLLHVGTSAGRSVFRGLERISYRAKSITTAISTVGGLVIDK